MNIIGDLERDLGHLLHHDHASPAQAAAAVTIRATPGGHVSNVFTEIKSGAHDLLEKLEGLDENAIGAVEAIKASPTGVSIVNEIAAIAHLDDPQGLLAGLLNAAKAVSDALRSATAATAATAQAVPAGPVVAGQA